MQKFIIKQILQWCVALLIGFLIVNALCMVYERPVGWIDTPNGASTSVWHPGTFLVHGTEGYSISRIDRNGYVNPDKVLDDSYILVMGASHTQGKEIPEHKRYSVLLNEALSDNPERLVVYNIAADGHFLPTQIKHFKAAVTAFPAATAIVIEIGSTNCSIIELRDSMDQVTYDASNAAMQFEELSIMGKIKVAAKEALPMLSRIKSQAETARAARAIKSDVGGYNEDLSEYRDVVYDALSLMRSEFDGPIVFLYHPLLSIEQNGDVSINYCATWDLFKDVCESNNIDVIDLGPAFVEAYYAQNKLPHGFSNSTPGTGHMNELGHWIAFKEIIRYLEGQVQ